MQNCKMHPGTAEGPSALTHQIHWPRLRMFHTNLHDVTGRWLISAKIELPFIDWMQNERVSRALEIICCRRKCLGPGKKINLHEIRPIMSMGRSENKRHLSSKIVKFTRKSLKSTLMLINQYRWRGIALDPGASQHTMSSRILKIRISLSMMVKHEINFPFFVEAIGETGRKSTPH